MDDLRRILAQMEQEERGLLKQRAEEVEAAAAGAKSTILFGTLLSLLLVTAAGILITRSLTSQIGSAVGNVQSSSAELQATANQQATGAKEQATAVSEITTTISELLVTSRQIAESAQRVAHIAEQTAGSAHSGQDTVEKAHELITGIRRQVDLVVSHMLDLEKKSQQIGSILEIVSELAEQTNILAINATIEAAGAGEAGKRFTVVADEIRKLADRVGDSTKGIRGLIEDVRSAVNTTVMATESGSKAVDAGRLDHLVCHADEEFMFRQGQAIIHAPRWVLGARFRRFLLVRLDLREPSTHFAFFRQAAVHSEPANKGRAGGPLQGTG
jgi:methyl-accepting chemotaxis protein